MLTSARVVMINRGGSGVDNARRAADSVSLPRLGEDPEDIVLCDAGNALIGFGFKQRQANFDANQCCSRLFLEDVNVEVVNPASEIALVTPHFDASVERTAQMLGVATPEFRHVATEGRSGLGLSFFDVDGNLTSFIRPTVPAQPTRTDRKILSLLERRSIEAGVDGMPDDPPVAVGATLLVSNIPRTLRFYRDTLGLEPLETAEKEVELDAGPVVLTLRTEPQLGLVRSLNARALLRDQIIFHVPDIRAEVQNLTDRGVEFPLGIEESISAGTVAYFRDPDGHNLWLWQPPTQFNSNMRIDFFPVLQRLLDENP